MAYVSDFAEFAKIEDVELRLIAIMHEAIEYARAEGIEDDGVKRALDYVERWDAESDHDATVEPTEG